MVIGSVVFPYLSFGVYGVVVRRWMGGCVDMGYVGGIGSFIGGGICGDLFGYEDRYRLWLDGILFGEGGDELYYGSLVDIVGGGGEYDKEGYFYQGLFYPFLLVRDDFRDLCCAIIEFVCVNYWSYEVVLGNFIKYGGVGDDYGYRFFMLYVFGGFDGYYGGGRGDGLYVLLMRRAVYMFFSYLYINNYGDFRNGYFNRDIVSMVGVVDYLFGEGEGSLIDMCIIFK